MKQLMISAITVAGLAGCSSSLIPASVPSAPVASPTSPTVLSPQQAQAAQAQQDKDRILSSPGWQPVPAWDDNKLGGIADVQDWVGVKCSSQPPDTPPNAAVGGNLTLTIWNPGPDDQATILDEVDFPGGGQSPVNPQDISINTVVAAGVVDVFHTSYTSLVGHWASGCYISTAGLTL